MEKNKKLKIKKINANSLTGRIIGSGCYVIYIYEILQYCCTIDGGQHNRCARIEYRDTITVIG